MKIWTTSELMALSTPQLRQLQSSVEADLATLPQGSAEHANALASLANIRAVLARRNPTRRTFKTPAP